MSTKKLQIIGSLGTGGNADTLDGKHADEFALASDVSDLQTLIGDTTVSEQVDVALANINNLVYVSEENQESAVVPLDADTLGGIPANKYAKLPNTTPVNLLINSNFRNPVNQNRNTSYTGTATAYTIDKWYASTAAVSINLFSSGINIDNRNGTANGHITQKIKGLKDAIYTLCINTHEGVAMRIFKLTGTTITSVSVVNTTNCFTGVGYTDSLAIQIGVFPAAVVTIYNAALYEGEYTLETLPKYQSKGYENELLVCRQYDSSTGEYIGLRKFGYVRNLLDNSDFTNPVNQRGLTSYVGAGRCIDRWRTFHASATVSIVNGGINVMATDVNPNIYQVLDVENIDTTKNMTAAACDIDGNIYLWHGIPSESSYSAPICVYITNGSTMFRLAKNSTWKWAALYYGEYTLETLPEYQPKGYAVELVECKRYFERIPQMGFIASNTNAGLFPTRFAEKRINNPSVSIANQTLQITRVGVGYPTVTFGNVYTNATCIEVAEVASGDLTIGSCYTVDVDISADL